MVESSLPRIAELSYCPRGSGLSVVEDVVVALSQLWTLSLWTMSL